ncbi:MAG: PP2C family protein-serine/threonine phosphatase, partial [Actinomycetota bacterium]
ARTLQQSLLPPNLPSIDGVALAATYRPAGEGLDVGGDFYDVFPTGRNAWGFVMGDVCGKGAEAASLTALARYTVRTAALTARKPSRILGTLNEAVLREEGDERYCTVTYTRLRMVADGAEIIVSSGGHPLPIVLRAEGEAMEVGRWGTAIGLFADTTLSDTTTALHAGDTLLLYTDGVVEARRGSELFGTERLRQTLEEIGPIGADALVRRVEQTVIDFSEGDLRDDLALLAVQVTR